LNGKLHHPFENKSGNDFLVQEESPENRRRFNLFSNSETKPQLQCFMTMHIHPARKPESILRWTTCSHKHIMLKVKYSISILSRPL
jgi:hypothetical protein